MATTSYTPTTVELPAGETIGYDNLTDCCPAISQIGNPFSQTENITLSYNCAIYLPYVCDNEVKLASALEAVNARGRAAVTRSQSFFLDFDSGSTSISTWVDVDSVFQGSLFPGLTIWVPITTSLPSLVLASSMINRLKALDLSQPTATTTTSVSSSTSSLPITAAPSPSSSVAKTTTSLAPSSSPYSTQATLPEPTGLSQSARIGIGVGVSLGVITIALAAATGWWILRRRRTAESTRPKSELMPAGQPSPAPMYVREEK